MNMRKAKIISLHYLDCIYVLKLAPDFGYYIKYGMRMNVVW